MRDVAFGQYYPTGSPIHRLDPRAKLIFSLLFMIFIFFAKSYTAFLYGTDGTLAGGNGYL